ncbi:MAG: HlyD family secretion protein, partial [Armatimonadota bacterium]
MKHSPKRILIPLVLVILIITVIILINRNREIDTGTLSASGVIEATETDIGSRVSGRIAKITVDEGDRVKKGQIIAVLDVPELNARVGQAEAAKTSTEARYTDIMRGTRIETIRQAQANYDMAVASSKGLKDVYSTITEAHTKSTELKANYEIAKANLQSAKQDMDVAAANLKLVTKGPR